MNQKRTLASGSGPKRAAIKLTKIDIAEAHIRMAVEKYFEGAHPAPILTLANSAREILASLGDALGVQTAQHELAAKRGTTVKKMMAPVSAAAGFMKHADRAPDASIDLDPDDVDVALHLACHDFGRITRGMPVEAQIFEAWSTARGVRRVSAMPFSSQTLLRRIIARFPEIRSANYEQQLKLGREALSAALKDSSLVMDIKRDVAALRHELKKSPPAG